MSYLIEDIFDHAGILVGSHGYATMMSHRIANRNNNTNETPLDFLNQRNIIRQISCFMHGKLNSPSSILCHSIRNMIKGKYVDLALVVLICRAFQR